MRVVLCFKASAKASMQQICEKSTKNLRKMLENVEIQWKLENCLHENPGLNTSIANLIPREVKVGEGDVVLQGVGESLRCAKCGNLKEIENCRSRGLNTLITNLISLEVEMGEGLIVLQCTG